jgi:hypothetical protein
MTGSIPNIFSKTIAAGAVIACGSLVASNVATHVESGNSNFQHQLYYDDAFRYSEQTAGGSGNVLTTIRNWLLHPARFPLFRSVGEIARQTTSFVLNNTVPLILGFACLHFASDGLSSNLMKQGFGLTGKIAKPVFEFIVDFLKAAGGIAGSSISTLFSGFNGTHLNKNNVLALGISSLLGVWGLSQLIGEFKNDRGTSFNEQGIYDRFKGY